MHNARQAFVCGFAFGMNKPLLMLAEHDYLAPLDYKDLLVHYGTARECVSQTEAFLERRLSSYRENPPSRAKGFEVLKLATELKALRIGDYIAENETAQLSEYFVETSEYRAALDGRHAIFVGRKGAGKTANLIRLTSVLREDKRNLVVVVQPVGYDLSGVTRLLRKYTEIDAKGYLVDSLWKFLVYSEIAQTAALSIEQRPGGPNTSAENELLKLYHSEASPLHDDFAVRLERALDALLPLSEEGGIEQTRIAISEVLHSSLLMELRRILGEVLSERERVAVLVDNLDKAWERNGDLEYLSELILGLLNTASKISLEFSKSNVWRKPVNLTLAIFVRSDIFQYIMGFAREPDKISFSRIVWKDRELLLRVLDERLVTSQRNAVTKEEIWERFFTRTVNGIAIRDYIISRTLPRPRDILYFVKVAVDSAINRNHSIVEETDIAEAEKLYSQFALDSIESEATAAALPEIEDVLFEFAGESETLDRNNLDSILSKARVAESRLQVVIDYLTAFGFLGLEIRDEEFEFATDENELRKNAVLARKLQETRSRPPRYKINVPFHAFLEIGEK